MAEAARQACDSRSAWVRFRRAAEPVVRAFRKAHADPGTAQRSRLAAVLAAARATPFGRQHGFANIDSYAAYTRQVPVRRWADMQPWIERACRERQPVLSATQPAFFEPTSGSSAAQKLIPYTQPLLVEFQQAIVTWLALLYDACPAIASGPGYWATSPPLPGRAPTENGIPVGGASDMTYLQGSCALPLLSSVLTPPQLTLKDNEWRIATLTSLVAAADLRMISVWSPTFLIALLRLLSTSKQAVDEVRRRVAPGRRDALDRALADGNFSSVWPDLEVMSCWMDGASERFATTLREQFPQARFSPKGLLATEGVVSISNGTRLESPLALTSHFLEFADAEERCVLADSLEPGNRYEPVLTTSGGLYRYALGDIVEYQGVHDRLHCIRFIGRADTRCDLVGEKLDEDLVSQALTVLDQTHAAATLVPMLKSAPAAYALLLDGVDAKHAAAAASRVERQLQTAHHYAQARRIGQLAALRAVPVADVTEVLHAAWESLGRRAGDLKPSRLITSAQFADAIMCHLAQGGGAA